MKARSNLVEIKLPGQWHQGLQHLQDHKTYHLLPFTACKELSLTQKYLNLEVATEKEQGGHVLILPHRLKVIEMFLLSPLMMKTVLMKNACIATNPIDWTKGENSEFVA